jgi:hypothetical protein
VFEYWTQNEQLRVVADIDVEVERPGNGHRPSVHRYLDLRVEDQRHGYTNNLAQRSSGFQWFFSFLTAFGAFERLDRRDIVLLDEPALTLHGRAQTDLLRFLEERLAARHQVIYSTHSPFMVDAARLDRVRIVEDRGPRRGAVVSDDVRVTDPDTLFPLQAGLGYGLAQSLFVAPDNLVCESASDFTYLTLLSAHLASLRRTALDPRWSIVPIGGARNIPGFVALLGRRLDVTVVVGAGSPDVPELTGQIERGLLERERVILVSSVVTSSHADVEDLFVENDYLTLYNGAFGTSLKARELPPGDRITRRIGELIGHDFAAGAPADFLLRNRDRLLPRLSATTLQRFEALFQRVNATLRPA